MAHINFPVDLQEHEGGERSKRNIPGSGASAVFGRTAGLPAEAELQRAAEILNAGQKDGHSCGHGCPARY